MTEHLEQINVTGTRARRLTYPDASMAEIESLQIPALPRNKILLKTLFSGISRGTESLVFKGEIPTSERERMKCPHMAGSFEFPVSYGYACVCEVVENGGRAEPVRAGERVFVLHPHQDYIEIEPSLCHKLPEGLPTPRAVLTANMETAVNAVWDAEIEGQPTCAVIGAGVVGLLTAHVVRELAGLHPIIFDINPAKEEVVRKLGFEFADPKHPGETPHEFGLLLHTSASQTGLQFALNHSAFEAKVVEMSWYGDRPVQLELGGSFHSRRLKIISSQVGAVAPAKRETFSYADRLATAMQLLLDDRLDALLDPPIHFHDLPDHVHEIFSPNGNALCQLIAYTD